VAPQHPATDERAAEHCRAERVHGTLRDVVRGELGVEAAGHQVDVEGAHFLRDRGRGVEPQRAAGRAPCCERAARFPQRGQRALDLRLHGPPGEFLRAVAQRAPRLEVGLPEHGASHFAGILRRVPKALGGGRRHLLVVVTSHALRHVHHQVLAQGGDEGLPCVLVVRRRGEALEARGLCGVVAGRAGQGGVGHGTIPREGWRRA
jgi:hypothetical protein